MSEIDDTVIGNIVLDFPSSKVTDLDHGHIFETVYPNSVLVDVRFFVQKQCGLWAAIGRGLARSQLAASNSDDRDKMVREFDWLPPDDPIRMPEL